MIMSAIIYFNSVSSLREEIEQSNINKLKQVESITDERMKQLATLAARISYDPRLTPYMISHSYYSGEAINELSKYKANSSIIEELFVYYHAKDTIYSTSGSYSINAFLQNKYQFDQWDKKELIQDLHTKEPFIRPTENIVVNNDQHKKIIAYLFPIAPNSPAPYGTVMYFIEESVMTDLIQNILGDFKGNAYIVDENDQVIAAAVNDPGINQQNVDLTMGKSGVANVVIDGKDYSLATVKSDVSGWRFLTLMDADQFFEKLDYTKTLIISILLVLLIIGLVLAVWLGRSQYKPIRSLFEMTNKDKERNALDGGNELDKIHHTITNVFKDHQILNETLYMQKPFARDQLLVRLLKGDVKDNGEIETMLDALNVKMKNGHYFVVIVYFEEGTFKADDIEEREAIFDLLSNISLPKVAAYGVDLLYNDAMAIVVSMDEAKDANIQRRLLVPKIQQYIQGTTLIEPTIGVGGLYNEKSRINRSYIEALGTMEYKFINPQGSIIYFEDISLQPEQTLGYPKEEQIKLVQSLKQGDAVVSAEALHNMFSMLAANDHSIHVSKCICFDIINTVVKTTSELGLSSQIKELNQMVDFNSIEQLHHQLRTLVLRICEKVEDKKESHNDKLKNDILDYIKKNYNLYELSLESIAVEFQLSVSYLSRFIKEQTGVNFTRFVQDLRMEDVKKRLRETDFPIKEIVADVGYKDVANFTRKFKKTVGVTPGQYRSLNK